jgi:Fe-S-cluster containining protein
MEEKDSIYGEEIYKLNLRKYGLEDLEGKNLLDLERHDIERLLAALGDDDISLNLPIPCTRENVYEILALSECRKCGKCCRPNPLNPKSPGIEVFEDELKAMTEQLHWSYEETKKKTSVGSVSSLAFQVIELGYTRWLPLPCPFHDLEKNQCQAYSARAVVCQIYPIIFTGDDTCMSIRVTCDYGKDLVVKACQQLKAKNPNLEINL